MNPSTSSTSITSLPREILLKILTGLPPKSAVRFRCSSKFFHSLIPEPSFTFKILVSLPSKTRPLLNLYTVNYREENHGRNLQADTAQLLETRGLMCLAGSSSVEGNLCLLSDETGDDVVFNLSTRRRISLPLNSRPADEYISCGDGFRFFFGRRNQTCRPISSRAVLGFDSGSDRFKVFKWAVYYYSGRKCSCLWVLTLGVDELWREKDPIVNGYVDAVIHVGGVIYLIPRTTRSMIVALDVVTERLITLVPFPLGYHSWEFRQSWVKLNGRLAFVNITKRGDLKSEMEIWTLERSMKWERRVVVLSWEERKVFEEATSIGFTGNSMGEIVFVLQSITMTPLVLVYSFRREIWRRFEISGVRNYSFLLPYMRSIVHVEEEIATFLE